MGRRLLRTEYAVMLPSRYAPLTYASRCHTFRLPHNCGFQCIAIASIQADKKRWAKAKAAKAEAKATADTAAKGDANRDKSKALQVRVKLRLFRYLYCPTAGNYTHTRFQASATRPTTSPIL